MHNPHKSGDLALRWHRWWHRAEYYILDYTRKLRLGYASKSRSVARTPRVSLLRTTWVSECLVAKVISYIWIYDLGKSACFLLSKALEGAVRYKWPQRCISAQAGTKCDSYRCMLKINENKPSICFYHVVPKSYQTVTLKPKYVPNSDVFVSLHPWHCNTATLLQSRLQDR